MKNNDVKMLEERYEEVSENIFNRMKAGASAKRAGLGTLGKNIRTAAKGVTQGTKALSRGAKAVALGDKEGARAAGQSAMTAAGTALSDLESVPGAQNAAKVTSILQSFQKKAEKLSTEIKTDIEKLGLDQNQSAEVAKALEMIQRSANLLNTVVSNRTEVAK